MVKSTTQRQQQLDRLEQKIDKLDTLDLIYSRFTDLEKKDNEQIEGINRLGNKLEKIETNDLLHVKRDSENIHKKLDSAEIKINEIDKEVSSHNGKLTIIISLVFAILASIVGLAITIIKNG